MKVTAETLSWKQFMQLYDVVAVESRDTTAEERELRAVFQSALNPLCHRERRNEAFERIAAAWNARHGADQ